MSQAWVNHIRPMEYAGRLSRPAFLLGRIPLWSALFAFAFASVGAEALTLTAAQSRKAHGAAGNFDISIDTTQNVAGALTVEPRVADTGHQIVFQFDAPITAPGNAAATDENDAPIGTATTAATGNDVVVTLTGIPDNKRVTISLMNVNGGFSAPPVAIGFMVGDVNNTRSVNSSDISGVKARSGQTTTASNFLFDLNLSGTINSSDISAVKARSGQSIPVANSASLQIAAARAAADGAVTLPIANALVTYVKPLIGADPAGFFVQSQPLGPALFIAVDPATLTPLPAVGDRISFTITTMATVASLRQAMAVSNYARLSTGNTVGPFVQEVSNVTDLAGNVDAYESEIIRATGTIAGAFQAVDSGFVAAPFNTVGVSGSLQLRVASALVSTLNLAQGCRVTANQVPMWRSNATAQVSGWVAGDITSVSCAPAFTSQPANVTINAGQNAQFTVAVSGTPAPALRWQSSGDGGATWSDIAGQTSSVLNVLSVVQGDNGRQFRAVASNSAGVVTSTAATLTVNAAPVPKAWQAATRISPPIFGDAYNYRIAYGTNGDAIAVWSTLATGVGGGIISDILASRYTPTTGWEPAIDIDAGLGQAGEPQIGMDASGNAIVVWQETDGAFAPRRDLWSNRYVAGAGWQGASPFMTPSGGSPQIAVAANGQAIFTWSQRTADNSGAETASRTFVPGSGWSGITSLATGTDQIVIVGGVGYVSNPGAAKVSIDASGNSMAVWMKFLGTQFGVFASRNGGPAELIQASGGLSGGPYEVASNASGETIAVWAQRCVLWANRYVPGTGWGTPTALQSGNPTCGVFPTAQVAIDASGNAIVAWGNLGNRYTAGVGWLGASQITNGGNFQFAMNAAGKALAVWRSGTILAGNSDYVAGYNFFPSVLVYGDSGLDATGLKIAMDADGNAIALFKRGGDATFGNTIWAAVYK